MGSLIRRPLLSVVVPAYAVEEWLPRCLASLVGQTYRRWEAIVVDDGSPDRSGEIAEEWARRDRRIRVLHQSNQGLGAARNKGISEAHGRYLTFLDSDDVVPPTAYSELVGQLAASRSDFITGSVAKWEHGALNEPRWMARLHGAPLRGIQIGAHPEILGDVFAVNKVFRAGFWESAGLSWPEGTRYEDQPATTEAYLTGTFDVVPEIVYHWHIRDDGTSITQQRSSLDDLRDRIATKRSSLDAVRAHGDPCVERIFLDRVLAGDLHRYFVEIPRCPDAWWDLLHTGIVEFWGDRSLVHSGLPPVHRLCGWLVEQGRRSEASALMTHVAEHPGPLPRRTGEDGAVLLDVPPDLVDLATVAPEALTVRPAEV